MFARNKYVAVGGGASLGHVLVTTDGKTWRETHRANTRIVPIVYGNHRFVVGRGLDFEFSPDGETWTTGGHLPYDRGLYFRRAAFGNGVFVFCGDCDLAPNTPRGGWRATSADGITIASFVTDLPNTRSIAFGAGRFVLIGEHGLRETSTDGKVWTKAFDPQEDFRWVFWTGRQFVLGGNATYVSPDGLHWTKDSAANVPCEPQCVGPDGLIGVSWKTNLWRSDDGLQWQKSVDDGTNAYTSVAYGTPKPAPPLSGSVAEARRVDATWEPLPATELAAATVLIPAAPSIARCPICCHPIRAPLVCGKMFSSSSPADEAGIRHDQRERSLVA